MRHHFPPRWLICLPSALPEAKEQEGPLQEPQSKLRTDSSCFPSSFPFLSLYTNAPPFQSFPSCINTTFPRAQHQTTPHHTLIFPNPSQDGEQEALQRAGAVACPIVSPS